MPHEPAGDGAADRGQPGGGLVAVPEHAAQSEAETLTRRQKVCRASPWLKGSKDRPPGPRGDVSAGATPWPRSSCP